VPEAALCLTLAASSLDAEGHLADPAQAARVKTAMQALVAAGATL
jgi:hypothetical protein